MMIMTPSSFSAETSQDHDILRGVIIFDNDKAPAAGWACKAGEAPFRIASIAELGTDCVYWTSADYNAFMASGFRNNPWLRDNRYLRVSMVQAIEDLGLLPFGADQQVPMLADLHARIVGLAMLGAQEARQGTGRPLVDMRFNASTLSGDLAGLWSDPEMPVREQAPACRNALQEWTRPAEAAYLPETHIRIVLRRNRVSLLNEILRVPLPAATGGHWRYVKGSEMPPGRVDWLLAQGQPFMARLVVSSATEDEAFSVFGFGLGMTGAGDRRTWAAAHEVLMLARIANVEIEGAWIAGGFDVADLPVPGLLSRLLVAGEYSWSAGVLAENLWIAGTKPSSRRSARGGGGGGRPVSWRAAWLRSSERVSAFMDALSFHGAGYSVLGYGGGTIHIGIHKDDLPGLIEDAHAQGYVVPAGLLERGLLSEYDLPQVDPEAFGQAREAWSDDKALSVGAVDATLRASGEADLIWSLDEVAESPVSGVTDRVRQIMAPDDEASAASA
jgi:hypothetical protein